MNGFLTVQEAAEIAKVNPVTIRRKVKAGEIKAAKIGTRIRIRREDFDKYMEGG